MQIGTSYTNYNLSANHTVTKQNESKTKSEETQTFSSVMNNENTEEESKILKYLDKHNAFDSLNEEDAKLFRELLSDGDLDDEDMKKLSFEQTQIMHGFILRDGGGEGIPISGLFKGKSMDLMSASTYTSDNNFNKTIYKTMEETEDPRVRSNYFSMLWLNLSQLASGNETLPGFREGATIGNLAGFGPHNKDNVNIDFEKFLYSYTAKIQENMNSTQDSIDIFKQYKEVNDFYTKVLDNYTNSNK